MELYSCGSSTMKSEAALTTASKMKTSAKKLRYSLWVPPRQTIPSPKSMQRFATQPRRTAQRGAGVGRQSWTPGWCAVAISSCQWSASGPPPPSPSKLVLASAPTQSRNCNCHWSNHQSRHCTTDTTETRCLDPSEKTWPARKMGAEDDNRYPAAKPPPGPS